MQVGLNTQAMVATSLLHASILRSGKLYVDEAAEAEYMRQCLTFVTEFHVGMAPPAPRRTFAQHWETRCERDWRWAFQLFSLGAPPRAAGPPPPGQRVPHELPRARCSGHTHEWCMWRILSPSIEGDKARETHRRTLETRKRDR